VEAPYFLICRLTLIKAKELTMTDEMKDTDDFVKPDELTLLKERADLMKLKYHPSIGVKKLKAMVEEALNDGKAEEKEEVVSAGEETIQERNMRLKKTAHRLVRVKITNMNPHNAGKDGDFYEIGNKVIGTIRRFIPFHADEAGWHVPFALLNMLKEKQYQTFYDVKVGKKKIKKSKLVREFAIEELAPLTEDELHDLAMQQAAAHSIDQ
jgi:hypothetical protein